MVEIKFKSMKELKKVVLGIILISSFSLTAQDTEESKINSREVKSIEKISHINSLPRIDKLNFKELADIATKKLATDLSLSKEQIETVRKIEFGLLQKNQSIRDNRELTVEEKQTYLKKNNQKRSAMIARVLTPVQVKIFEKLKLKEKKLPKKKVNFKKLADIATKKLATDLSLSKEQIETVRKIEFGLLQKEQLIRDNRELTLEEKQTYLKHNNQKRSTMITRVLTPEQGKIFEKLELREKKAKK